MKRIKRKTYDGKFKIIALDECNHKMASMTDNSVERLRKKVNGFFAKLR